MGSRGAMTGALVGVGVAFSGGIGVGILSTSTSTSSPSEIVDLELDEGGSLRTDELSFISVRGLVWRRDDDDGVIPKSVASISWASSESESNRSAGSDVLVIDLGRTDFLRIPGRGNAISGVVESYERDR